MTQPASPDHAGTETPVSGYGLALKTGFQETTRRVQDMHRAIADLSFRALRWIPGMAGPAIRMLIRPVTTAESVTGRVSPATTSR